GFAKRLPLFFQYLELATVLLQFKKFFFNRCNVIMRRFQLRGARTKGSLQIVQMPVESRERSLYRWNKLMDRAAGLSPKTNGPRIDLAKITCVIRQKSNAPKRFDNLRTAFGNICTSTGN